MLNLTVQDYLTLIEKILSAVIAFIIIVNSLGVSDPIYIIIGTMIISFVLNKVLPW